MQTAQNRSKSFSQLVPSLQKLAVLTTFFTITEWLGSCLLTARQHLIGMVGVILIGFLHIFVSAGYPISHKIILKCPFVQTAQNRGKSFFPS